MQRGRGQGRRRGSGRRRRVISFLQPCLLVLLHRGQAHGYNLLSGLEEFRFTPGQSDPSLVYRALREMETIGLVTSEWDSDSQGPQRRVYQITAEGEAYLVEWVNDLKRTREEIDALLKANQDVERNERLKGGDGL
jgi:PadR family transcriptional regulator PadR